MDSFALKELIKAVKMLEQCGPQKLLVVINDNQLQGVLNSENLSQAGWSE